jgi:hypothetical protein
LLTSLYVYVIDPKYSSQTLLDGGRLGSAIFSINPKGSHYQLDVNLHDGKNDLNLFATDLLGRPSRLALEVRFGNMVEDWNAAALQVVRQWNTLSNDPFNNRLVTSQPPLVARNMAMIHEAIYNAVAAIDRSFPGYHSNVIAQPGTDLEIAAAAAAWQVARSLYAEPDELAVWQATLDETTQHSNADPTAQTIAMEFGKKIGQAVLQDRANDGAKAKLSYQPSGEISKWNRAFPDYLPPLLPQWPQVTPFVLSRGDQFRPDTPPGLGSLEYA